jgi:hypothetical protein
MNRDAFDFSSKQLSQVSKAVHITLKVTSPYLLVLLSSAVIHVSIPAGVIDTLTKTSLLKEVSWNWGKPLQPDTT